MHPINSKNFGAGKVKVFFYDGLALTSGYVVQQLGSRRYKVTDGTTTKVVHLAQTLAHAQMLDGTLPLDPAQVANLCTMTLTVGAVAKYVTKLTSVAAVTVDGAFSWTLGAPAGSVYALTKHAGGATALVNTSAPVISGSAKVGQLLTATNGVWTGAPTSFTYVWKLAGVVITGATTSTYTTVVGDLGKTITVTVTAVKAGVTSVSVTSAATAPIAA